MSDENQLQNFDPEALINRIKTAVRNNFGMLIPEAAFDEMVNNEINAFFHDSTKLEYHKEETQDYRKDTWSINTEMTPFRQIVWSKLYELANKRIRQVIDDKYPTTWSEDNFEETSSAVQELIESKLEELAPKMAQSMFKNMLVDAVSRSKSEVKDELNESLRQSGSNLQIY